MRITGGKFKNREVFSAKDKEGELRPTSSRTREAVFNLLKHGKFLHNLEILTEDRPSLLDGRIVADIFCGTGIMAFEAASRGASKMIFVDKNGATLDLARKTAEKLGVTEDCEFVRASAVNLPFPPAQAEIIFFDPPYNKELVNPSLLSIAKNRWLRNGGIVVCEHSKQEKLGEIPMFELLDQRSYGNCMVSILKINC